MLLISEAIAQETNQGTPPQPDTMTSLVPLILIFFIFYFLIIRPQQKKIKEHNEMVDALKKGDEVVTGGGVVGKIKKAEDSILHVEIAPEIVVKVLRNTVSNNKLSDKDESRRAVNQNQNKK